MNFFRSTEFAPIFDDAALTAMDIGSRGGFDPDLLPIAWAVDGIGFEPDPAALAELHTMPTKPWRSLRFLPAAIGAATGSAVLHVPADPIGASLLPHDTAIGKRFRMEHLTECARTVPVETVTLDEAAQLWTMPPASYLKLDVEGAELDVLKGAGTVLHHVVAIKTEAAFLPVRLGQPLAADLDRYLRAHGFVLMDMVSPHHWRRGPLAPHPYVSAHDPAYSRGQIIQCDMLFFRDPAAIAEDDCETALRAGLIAMALGFFDHASMLFERPAVSTLLSSRYGLHAPTALNTASRAMGRRVALAELKRQLRGLIPLLRSLSVGVPAK